MAQSILEILIKAKDEASGALGNVGGVIGDLGPKVGLALGAMAVAVAGAGAGLISLGSDAEEMLGKFNIVFGAFAGPVATNIETFAHAVGRNKFELMGLASGLQDTLVPMGFARDQAAHMSEGMTKLAVDLGSFNNLNTDEVMRDIQSALVGNTESIRKYGVVANEAAIKQEAMTLGLATGKGELTQQAKALAIMSLLTKGTSDAQGDAIRTSGGWANQMRLLQSSLTEAATAAGMELLPAVTPLLQQLNQGVQGILPQAVQIFKEFATTLGGTLGPSMLLLQDAWNRVMVAIGQSPGKMTPGQAALEGLKVVLNGVVTAVQLVAVGAELLATGVEKASEAVKIAQGLWANFNTILDGFKVPGAIAGLLDRLSGTGGTTTFGIATDTSAVDPNFIPGSPTPFEIGLMGIKNAIGQVNATPLKVGGSDGAAMAGGSDIYGNWKDRLAFLKSQQGQQGGDYVEQGLAGESPEKQREIKQRYTATAVAHQQETAALEKRQAYEQSRMPHFQPGWERGPQPAAGAPAQPLGSEKVQTTLDAILGKLSDPPPIPEIAVHLDGQQIARVVSDRQGGSSRSLARFGGHAPLH